MNKRLRTLTALLLILAMSVNIASCSSIEDFFDLDHGSSRTERRRSRDDDDDEEEETTRTSRPGRDDPTDTPAPTVTVAADNGLTYPDHIPTYEEIHPAHPNGTVSGQDAVDILDDIEDQIIREQLGGCYVNADIFFEDYERYGITFEPEDIGWGEVLTDHDEDAEEVAQILDQLYSIDRDSLDTDDRIFYDKLLYDMELSAYAVQWTAFDYYESALKSLTGPQSEVLFILEVLEFDTVEDAENYILVLRDIDRYYDELCDFEEERAAYGYVNSDDVYEEVAESFDNLVAQSEDCFLYDSFRDRLDNIEGLTDSEREALIEEHDEVMHDIVFPEFEECAQRIRALKCGAPEVGVCSYPGGDAYFAYIFATQTNSGRTIDESIDQLEAYADDMMNSLYALAAAGSTDWFDEYLDHNYSEGDTQDNLDYLYEQIQGEFPPIPEHGYRLLSVPEVFADSFSPAAYLGYHLDNYDSNIIITNEASINDTFGITCAHEGYPGHMYQSVYTRSITRHPYMYLFDSIGYDEGWTTYVENYAFRYFSDSAASVAVSADDRLNILLFARFDMGINYEGWDAQDCADWLNDLTGGIATAESMMDVYNILLSDPGYGVKYGVGFINTGLIMAELQEEFPNVSDIDIHAAYLNAQTGTYEQILENARQFLEDGDVTYPVESWGDTVTGNVRTPQGSDSGSGSGSGGGLLGH
ncbi:MAG: DUF885 family protein [Clostridiales bacterium]|nr:DUF885 family protein [Clostridiales bacterium]